MSDDASTTTTSQLFYQYKHYSECSLAKYNGDVYTWHSKISILYHDLELLYSRLPDKEDGKLVSPWYHAHHYMIMIDTWPPMKEWVSHQLSGPIPLDVEEIWRGVRDEYERLKFLKQWGKRNRNRH